MISTDAWGIDDGWFDVEGHWHAASAGDHRGHPRRDGRTRRAAGVGRAPRRRRSRCTARCELRLEDGTDLGAVQQLPPDLPLGLHELVPLDGGVATTLLVGPGQCFLPDGLREWGVTVQVPTARSSRSWGIGDLADVRAIGEWIARRGGQVVALSPLHAPTPVVPIAASPYYPSSRRWRSPLLIRVDEVGTVDGDVLASATEAWARLSDPLGGVSKGL